MSFIWPVMLLALLMVPLLVILYLRLQERRRKMATRFGSMGLGSQSTRPALTARRHVPPIFFLIGLMLLALALARPQAVVSLPRVQGTVILAFDVSGSMAAQDIEPTRMEAAKAAAKEFVERQPVTVRVGVVAFSEGGFSVQVPTNDKDAILATINRLAPTRGTSLANGIYTSLTAIQLAESGEVTNYYSNQTPEPTPEPTPVPQGTFAPATIVLLSDGENTVQPDPIPAVQAAMDRGVRIHTIGVGSPEGATLKIEGFNIHTQLDEATLQQISQMTSGTYHNARNQEDLRAIYQSLGSQLVVKPEETEITSIFVGIGIVALLIGAVLSLLWYSRLP